MKCRHSFVCLLLLMFSIFGCNQGKNKTPKVPSDNGKQGEKEGEITFQIKKGTGTQSSFVPLDQMIPASGIPYTATEKEINPEGRLVLKASAKDVTFFNATIIAPEKDAPLEISGKIDLFDVVFKRVDKPTLVKVRFSHYAKGNTTNTIYKDVAFNILPEPKITKVEGKDVKLIIGIDYDLSDEALTFTTSPEKIGEINAEAYMLQASKKVTFGNSSDVNVATITNGKVHTLKQGETKIELLCNNEKKGELKIVVEDKKAPTRISCLTQDITLAEGESQDIVLIPTPIDASLNLSDWKDSTLSGEKIGKIEKKTETTYTITALKKGRTTFSAHSKYNKDVKINIILTVTDVKLEGISIDPPRISVGIGETKQLKIVARPDNASVAVTWKSNSPETVSVNESGQITALKNGNAIVTATSLSDATKTANCIVIVTKKIEKIELNHEVAELVFGDTLQLQATVTPSDAPQGISWHADSLCDEKIEDLLTITTAGLVKAKNKAGYAKIVATSDADNEKRLNAT